MRLVSYLLGLVLAFSLLNAYAEQETTSELDITPQKIEWHSQDLNNPFMFIVPKPVTLRGTVHLDSGVSAKIKCMIKGGRAVHFVVYKGGSFACHNAESITILSTGANDHAKGHFTISIPNSDKSKDDQEIDS